MREPHYGHADTVYDGKMYISGGITHDSFQKELLCYDPHLDTWEQRTPMTVVRGLHCMTTFRDKLFVIGGNHFRGSTDYDDVLGMFLKIWIFRFFFSESFGISGNFLEFLKLFENFLYN